MIQAKVTNHGGHPVHRIGFTFQPGESQDVEVLNARQLLALQAVRTLDVVVQEPAPEVKPLAAEVEPAKPKKNSKKK